MSENFTKLPLDPDLGPEQLRIDYRYNPVEKPRIFGFPFPLSRNSPRGFFYRAVDFELIRADLLQLILTEPGERVMMPQYGVGLRRLIFEQGDNILYADIESRISQAIGLWEKRIVVQSISVSSGENDQRLSSFEGREHSVIVSISYSLKDNLENIDNLVFRVNFNSNILS